MKNNNIEFEPKYNFNSNNIDLPIYYSADGEDGDEEMTEYESEETEVGGVEQSDLPRFRDLVKGKKLELKAQYGKGRFDNQSKTERQCKTIQVPQGYSERVCKNVFGKQVCANVPKIRMVGQEVCVNVPSIKVVWIAGWRRRWNEFKRAGGLAQLKMQAKGLAPIVETPIVTETPTPPTPTPTPTPVNQRAKFLLRGTSRSLKNDIEPKAVVIDSEVKKTNSTNDESSKESEKKSESKEAESKDSVETSDKILGMPKMVAIGVGIAILAIGGFVVYKKFTK